MKKNSEFVVKIHSVELLRRYCADPTLLLPELQGMLQDWEEDIGQPHEDDLRFEMIPAPASVHLEGVDPLSHRVDVGRTYTLTPGQRKWVREHYDMTPTKEVIVRGVATWPDTLHPRYIKVESMEHDPDPRRKAVMREFVINRVGSFFRESRRFDKELEEHKSTSGTVVKEISLDWCLVDIGIDKVKVRTDGTNLVGHEVWIKWKDGRSVPDPEHEGEKIWHDPSWVITRNYHHKPRVKSTASAKVEREADDLMDALDDM